MSHHLSANIPDDINGRLQVLLGHRQMHNTQKRFDYTDVVVDALNIGVKVLEAEAYSGIMLLVSKEIR